MASGRKGQMGPFVWMPQCTLDKAEEVERFSVFRIPAVFSDERLVIANETQRDFLQRARNRRLVPCAMGSCPLNLIPKDHGQEAGQMPMEQSEEDLHGPLVTYSPTHSTGIGLRKS